MQLGLTRVHIAFWSESKLWAKAQHKDWPMRPKPKGLGYLFVAESNRRRVQSSLGLIVARSNFRWV